MKKERQMRYIGCYGIILKNDKIALIRKARGCYIGKLDLPGGGFEHPEMPEECVTREILEETGLKVTNVELFDATSANTKWHDPELDDIEDLHHIGILYLIEYEDKELKADADGLDSLGANWYDLKTLNLEELSPFARYAVNKLRIDN